MALQYYLKFLSLLKLQKWGVIILVIEVALIIVQEFVKPHVTEVAIIAMHVVVA